MATAKTGVIKLSGLTITEKTAGESVNIKGSGGVRLSMTTVDDEETTKLVGKKTASYILEDYKQLFTGNRASVSLFGSEVEGFDATEYDKYSAVKVINATAVASTAGALSLIGNDNANQIIAGAGGATLDGGAGNDTLTGGKGVDVFRYNAGNDIIKSFTANTDSVVINNEDFAIADASVSGSHVVLKFDSKNSLKVEGMAKKSLTFTDGDGTEKTLNGGVLYSGDNASVTSAFTKSSKSTVDAANIYVLAEKKAVNLVGNSSDNSIFGGAKNDTLNGAAGADTIDGGAGNDKLYGGAGDDVLYCGKGNDSLWGDDGANKFIYASGDGKDVIFGFTSDDTLTLDDVDFTSATVSNKGKQVALKIGSGSITFKSFDADTTFNIGDETYQVVQSGNKYTFETVASAEE